MKDRRNKTLAHVHSVKENSRKLRFKSRQRLQNFRAFTGGSGLHNVVPDGSELKPYADRVQKTSKNLTAAPDLWIDAPNDNESDQIDPKSSTSRSSSSINSPKSILSASRGDPFESLPVNSARVEFLVNSRKCNYRQIKNSVPYQLIPLKMPYDPPSSHYLASMMRDPGAFQQCSLECFDLGSAIQRSSTPSYFPLHTHLMSVR